MSGRTEPWRALAVFVCCVLIWGSTWYAITFQIAHVGPLWGVTWRFLLAGAILMLVARLRRLPIAQDRRTHRGLLMLGLFMFSASYVLVYVATGYIPSGLVAVIYALMMPFNQVNAALFLKERLDRRLLVAGSMGVAGVALMLVPPDLAIDSRTLAGAGICLVSAWIASLGNTTAATGFARRVPNLVLNAWGMLYGAALVAVAALVTGEPPAFPLVPEFLLSLLWLAVLGSVVAFTLYVWLIQNWGLQRAGYVAVVVPVVAMLISTVFEGYAWQPGAVAGLVLVVAGNLLLVRAGDRAGALSRRREPRPPRRTHR